MPKTTLDVIASYRRMLEELCQLARADARAGQRASRAARADDRVRAMLEAEARDARRETAHKLANVEAVMVALRAMVAARREAS